MGKNPKHGLAARKRVVSAHEEGQDWELVASCNDIPLTTARNIVQHGRHVTLYTMKQVRVEPATCNEVSGFA
ncbi:hypothetical protein PC112_g17756 [Phytophthora cactorum]|nr:hypothetical protein PC112_g17756 [Phytophthora cactorum]